MELEDAPAIQRIPGNEESTSDNPDLSGNYKHLRNSESGTGAKDDKLEQRGSPSTLSLDQGLGVLCQGLGVRRDIDLHLNIVLHTCFGERSQRTWKDFIIVLSVMR